MREPIGVYIHFPFCVKKCNYCDFLSGPANSEMRSAYVDALCREIQTFGGRRGANEASRGNEKIRVDTVFLGGGTPSVMDPADLTRVMETVRETFDVLPGAEISMEMNPGTFREDLLAFANINVDLMSAIPGQTLASWVRTLSRVLEKRPEHISCYSLIVEEGTPFYALYEAGRLDLPDEDEEREMYYETERRMEAHGYHRYEISNYARPGHECRHNVRYWRRSPYAGFGIGAASLIDETRWNNTRDLQKYLCGSGSLGDIREDIQQLSVSEQMEEFMFLGLRMMEGVSASDFAEAFSCELDSVFGEACERLISEGLLVREGDRYKLTSRGIDVSNAVLAEFLL